MASLAPPGIDPSNVAIVINILLILFMVYEILTLRRTVDTIDHSVDQIEDSVNVLKRTEIYFHLSKSIEEADEYVHHLSVAQPPSDIDDPDERDRAQEFLSALETAEGNEALPVRILGPDRKDSIGGLWERRQRGCDVRVDPSVDDYDLRMQIVDRRTVIVGIASPGQQRSRQGFKVDSVKLAEILDNRFTRIWNEATDLEDHAVEQAARQVQIQQTRDGLKQSLHNSLDLDGEVADNVIDELVGETVYEIGEYLYDCDYVDDLRSPADGVTVSDVRSAFEDHNINLTDEEARRVVRWCTEGSRP